MDISCNSSCSPCLCVGHVRRTQSRGVAIWSSFTSSAFRIHSRNADGDFDCEVDRQHSADRDLEIWWDNLLAIKPTKMWADLKHFKWNRSMIKYCAKSWNGNESFQSCPFGQWRHKWRILIDLKHYLLTKIITLNMSSTYLVKLMLQQSESRVFGFFNLRLLSPLLVLLLPLLELLALLFSGWLLFAIFTRIRRPFNPIFRNQNVSDDGLGLISRKFNILRFLFTSQNFCIDCDAWKCHIFHN